jgi:hypothetical protein
MFCMVRTLFLTVRDNLLKRGNEWGLELFLIGVFVAFWLFSPVELVGKYFLSPYGIIVISFLVVVLYFLFFTILLTDEERKRIMSTWNS